MDCLRHRRSLDHAEPQSARMAENEGSESRRHRNSRHAHLDGLAKKSGRPRPTIISIAANRTHYPAFTESRFSDATYFTAAVRSSLSQANLRPSSARFSVLNSTTENNCR